MYLGYREWDCDLKKDVFVVCLEGTHADIERVKHTSTYFSQDRFEMITYNKIKKDNLILVSKSGRELTSSFIPEDMGIDAFRENLYKSLGVPKQYRVFNE